MTFRLRPEEERDIYEIYPDEVPCGWTEKPRCCLTRLAPHTAGSCAAPSRLQEPGGPRTRTGEPRGSGSQSGCSGSRTTCPRSGRAGSPRGCPGALLPAEPETEAAGGGAGRKGCPHLGPLTRQKAFCHHGYSPPPQVLHCGNRKCTQDTVSTLAFLKLLERRGASPFPE